MPRKFRIWLAVLGATLLINIGIVAYQCRPINVAREFGIETPNVPSPNAHDAYLAATKAFDSKPVALILDLTVDQNQEEDPKKYPPGPKKLWVAENARGFASFENAHKIPYFYPPVRTALDDGEPATPYPMRQLAKYLEVRNQVWAQDGQTEKAVQGAIDIWEMGLKSATGAPMTPALNGAAIEIYARRSLGGEIAHLNGPQAARAAKRLEKLLSTRVAFADILRTERDAMLFQISAKRDKAIYDVEREKKVKAQIERGETVIYDGAPPPKNSGPFVNFVVRRWSAEYAKAMDGLITDASVLWPKRNVTPASEFETNPTTNKLIDALSRGRFHFVRSDAMGQIFLARLALHAFRKDKGVYPPKLSALVPQYLAKVPLDPFSEGSELNYLLDGKRYKLWSVGPDARDDGGRPAENPNPLRPSSRFLVRADSIGDIVANISR